MGGNAVGTVKKTGENTKALKIPIKDIGIKEFRAKVHSLLKEINALFEKKFKDKLWVREDLIMSGFMFNGSTSFIMDPEISDEEILKFKQSAGDMDIIVPEEHKENLWDLLDSLEDKEVLPGIIYKGSNRPTKSSVTDQINCVFLIDFENGIRATAQIDWEFLTFEDSEIFDGYVDDAGMLYDENKRPLNIHKSMVEIV